MTGPTADNPSITTCDPVEGYAPQVGRYVAQMAEVRDDLKHEVEGLGIEQIDWHPDENTESIATLLLHIDAVEWSWIFEDIFGRPDSEYPGEWSEAMPIRVSVPQVQGRPLEWYFSKLDATRARTLDVLKSFTDEDLKRLVGESDPGPGHEKRTHLYTIDWIIWHIIEHEATHVGQIELLKRLGPQPGSIQSTEKG
ncbi:MAG: DinB family protein [Chloroflexia bacterium]